MKVPAVELGTTKKNVPRYITVFSQVPWYVSRCTRSYIYRAFSDLFGKFLLPMKMGKKCLIWGKNMTILEKKNSAVLSNIEKINLLNWDFSANLECSRSTGNFSANWENNLVPETAPSFVYRKSPDIETVWAFWCSTLNVWGLGNSIIFLSLSALKR